MPEQIIGETTMTTTTDLNALIKLTKSLLQNKKDFRDGLRLLVGIRDLILNPDEPTSVKSLYGQLHDGLSEADYHRKVNKKSRTIAYGIWHSTRIEDMTMNRLILKQNQIFDHQNAYGAIIDDFRDTGNELNEKEIVDVSKRMKISNLLNYQNLVWKTTNTSILGLSFDDLTRKADKNALNQLLEDGSVSKHKDAIWLIDFWGNKTVAGLLMMPICRHQIVHLNENMEAKTKGKSIN